MIGNLIRERRDGFGGIRYAGQLVSWKFIWDFTHTLMKRWSTLRGQKIGFFAADIRGCITGLAALELLDAHVVLIPSAMATKTEQLSEYGITSQLLIDGSLTAYCNSVGGAKHLPNEKSVSIFSSGTTGMPTLRAWKWSGILRAIKKSRPNLQDGKYVSAYPFETFAGIQAAVFACHHAKELIHISNLDDLSQLLSVGGEQRLMMGTPTFYQTMLAIHPAETLRRISPSVISMGGEPAGQKLLNCLRETYPNAQLTHVYATSQHGSVFCVSDGNAGFPASWIGRSLASGCCVAINDGELHVKQPSASTFSSTGDAVTQIGSRILFQGRTSDLINVGGWKVSPAKVEDVIARIDGVEHVFVYGKPSRLVGMIVAADIVIASESSSSRVKEDIHGVFTSSYPAHERPRLIRFVDRIEATTIYKRKRKAH